jgi:hypothetical protein
VSPDGRFCYGSNRVRDAEGAIVIFSVNQATGELVLVGHEPCGGVTPRNFALHPSGRWLLVANSGERDTRRSRCVSSFLFVSVCMSLSLSPRVPVSLCPSSPPYMGRFFLACSLTFCAGTIRVIGSDNIVVFDVDTESGRLHRNVHSGHGGVLVPSPICIQFVPRKPKYGETNRERKERLFGSGSGSL